MPAEINEAFISPSDNSHQSYGVLNEHDQSQVSSKSGNCQSMPKYQPFSRYPTLHPFGDDDSDSNLLRDPHQGAGWIQPTDPTYLTGNDCAPPIRNGTTDCDQLISQVLANEYCRRILKKLLLNNENKKTTSSNSLIEAFVTNNHILDTISIKNIITYCLGGILILCVLEIIFKITLVMTHSRL